MGILMLVIFIILAVFAWLCSGRNLLSPWFLLCLVFLATYLIVLINYGKWNVNISYKFVLYVITAILAFGCGTAIVNLKHSNAGSSTRALPLKDLKFCTKYPINLFLILSVVLACAYVFKLISDVGGVGSFSSVLRKIYDNRINDDYTPGFIFNQMSEVVMAIAYLNTFRIFLKIFSRGDKSNLIKLVVPILVFLITALIATDRNIFLRYGIYFICLWVLFYYQNCNKRNVNLRIIGFILLMAVMALLIFFFMGIMKQYSSDFINSLSIYGGSGLNDFNIWLNEFDGRLMYGQSTFTQLLNTIGVFLNPFGANIAGQVNRVDPFIEYISPKGYFYSSNVYTALKPYVEDFGYLGAIIFPLIIGMFYQWLFVKAKKKKYGFTWLAYCVLIYPIIFFPILEQLFRRFHLGFLYEIGWVAILYFCVFGKRKLRIKAQTIIKPEEIKSSVKR